MTSTPAPTLLILAAGMGSRYGGLKQIDPVGPNGEAILDYSVYDGLRAGFGKVVFIIRRDIEQAFRDTIGTRFESHIAVEYVFQELDQLPAGYAVPAGRTKPWGTTHAVLSAAEAIHEPFAVINADDFYGAEGYRLLADFLRAGTGDYAMAGFILRNTLSEFGSVARGICQVDGEGFLEQIVERTKIQNVEPEKAATGIANLDPSGEVTELTGDEVVSMNMWGFTPAVFNDLRGELTSFLAGHGSEASSEVYLPNSVGALIQAGRARVKVLPTHDAWLGVTYRDDRPLVVAGVERLIQQGLYPEKLWS